MALGFSRLQPLITRRFARRSGIGWLIAFGVVIWDLVDRWSRLEFLVAKLPYVKTAATAAWSFIISHPQLDRFALLVVGLIWIAVAALITTREAQKPRNTGLVSFKAQGFFWDILPTFRENYRLFPPDDHGYIGIRTIFQGPYCPRATCKMPAGDDLIAGRLTCSGCGIIFDPKTRIAPENKPNIISSANSDPLWPLTKGAYREAIAAERRGEFGH